MSDTCKQAFCCSQSTSGFGRAAMARILHSGPTSSATLFRFEAQRDAVHAIALAGRLRTVGKDVAKMPAAPGAMDLDPRHAVAAVGGRRNRRLDRAVETRPAAAALVFRLRGEQR